MTTTNEPPAVADWTTDFDHRTEGYAARAPEIWDELRDGCPIAHTDRFGGAWLPVRHADVTAIAHDTDHFSSQGIIVTDWRPDEPAPVGYAPPITSDPPFHEIARRLLLPAFSPRAIEPWEKMTRDACNELIDDLLARASNGEPVDAAVDYAQHIPVRVIADMLGVPAEDGDRFRLFIHRIMEKPGMTEDLTYEDTLEYYLNQIVQDHRDSPRDDLVDYLMKAEIAGNPLADEHVVGTIALLLIAGIDTTWSAIGASIWHLANNPEDAARLRADPELMTFAVEEFLRVYAPVTMARLVAEDIEMEGCPMKQGEWVLLPFPAANRDPEFFGRADEFILDRQKNRHAAFGLGIHRCIGSNLARMELRVALETWLSRVDQFEITDPGAVRWSSGQVRGPRTIPMNVSNAAKESAS